MKRKLVTIREISKIEDIKNADNIVKATVDGWTVVIKKGEFKVGDEVLFVEIDSFLPLKPEFEFLKNNYKKLPNGKEGYRLRSIRLRNVLSQGLILPISMLGRMERIYNKDYAKSLGIIKYEAPIPPQLSGEVIGRFPSDIIPKTDAQRIQNLPEYFDDYSDIEFEVSEKLDGSSCTMFLYGKHFGVCSRNLELKDNDNTLWKLAKKYKLEKKLSKLTQHAIQGEIIGEGVQKNPYKIVGQDFYVFNIWNIDERRYLTSDERINMCNELGLKHVPILYNIKLKNFTMDTLIKYSEGKSMLNVSHEREGLVFKSNTLINDNTVDFKVINNKYLLN